MTPTLEMRGVSRSFVLQRRGPASWISGAAPSRIVAVDKIDLVIAPGEAVGLVGESGCGKSTLARVVARLIAADAGEIRLDGAPIQSIAPDAFARSPLRRRIQMVFQDPTDSLAPHFTARRAIADPALLLLRDLGAAERAERVLRAAAQVGLGAELLDRLPHQLSGGQKARVGIARAMIVEPTLLILDEPTSALDVSIQALVLQLLARLRRESGVAMLFVSHALDVVRLICDRVAVMYLGQIVESGPARAVFDAPRHPYTRALLSAIPKPPGGAARRREHLDGEPRSPVDPDPHACRFCGRCPIEQPLCRSHAPPDVEIAPGRRVRCHFPLAETAR